MKGVSTCNNLLHLWRDCGHARVCPSVSDAHESRILSEHLFIETFCAEDPYAVWGDVFSAPDSDAASAGKNPALCGWDDFFIAEELVSVDSVCSFIRRIELLLQKLSALLRQRRTIQVAEDHCRLLLRRLDGVHGFYKSLVPVYDISTLPPPTFS